MNQDIAFTQRSKTNTVRVIDGFDRIKPEFPFIWDLHSTALLLGVTPQDISYMVSVRKLPWVKNAITEMKKTGKPDKQLLSLQNLGYTYFTIPKKSGGFRLLAAPKTKLRVVQAVILQEILKKIPIHSIASAYVPKDLKYEGWSWQNAIWDVAKDSFLVGTADITDFFSSIDYHMVNDALREETGYNKEVCWVLTQLLTEFGVTPQGALTSPALSNIIMKKIDAEVEETFNNNGWLVTRYSDNYVFGKQIDPYSETLIGEESMWPIDTLKEILSRNGFKINEKKSWCREKSAMKPFMGLVAYEKLNSPRYVYEKLRNAVHTFVDKREVPSLYQNDVRKYFLALRGKVNYWMRINSTRYQKLKDKLASVNDSFYDAPFHFIKKYNLYWRDTKLKQSKYDIKFPIREEE